MIEGRDIGSVVFPDARLKLYLTASPRVRAERRVAEVGGDVEAIAADIARRDGHDTGRSDGPLTRGRRGGGARHERAVDRRGARRDRAVAGGEVTQIKTELAGRSLLDRAAYSVVRNLLFAFLKLWCRVHGRGTRERPRRGPVHPRPDAPQHHRHPRRLDRGQPPAAVHGRRQVVEQQVVRQAADRARRLPRHPRARPTARRCAAASPCWRTGEPLVLFPEGERKSGPIVQPMMNGAAYIAVKAGVPIVPVGIGGSEKAMPKGARFIYPRKIVAIVGAADPGAASTSRAGCLAPRCATSASSCTTSCNGCSTPPRSAPAEPGRPASSVRA